MLAVCAGNAVRAGRKAAVMTRDAETEAQAEAEAQAASLTIVSDFI
jgi:hypothetical protein